MSIISIILIINDIQITRGELKEKEIIVEKIKNEEMELRSIEKTLKMAYSLNRFESRYYAYIFKDLSEEENIPWQLIAAVIWIESKYDPSATSIANCKGLMQLKDKTAKEVCESVNVRYYGNIVWNDIMNIVLGSHYLASDYHKKGLEWALKKYVGGPKIKKAGESKRYENWYKGRVKGEYIKLKYIHKGIILENKQINKGDNDG